MKYRNIKTGQIIDVPSEIRGENWEKIGGKAPTAEPVADAPAASEEKPAKKTRKK